MFQVIAAGFITIDIAGETPEEAARAWQEWRDAHSEIPCQDGQVLIAQDPLPRLFDGGGKYLGTLHRGRIVGK